MPNIDFKALDPQDQELLEALERGSQGERLRFAKRAKLDDLIIDPTLFPARFSPTAARDKMLFAAASRRNKRALLRMRTGSHVTWWLLWHSGYAVERVFPIVKVPAFGASTHADYDGEGDHEGCESVRAIVEAAAIA